MTSKPKERTIPMTRRFLNELGEREKVKDVFILGDKQLRENRNGDLYLQIEEHQLVVKIGVPDKSRRREVRDHWCRRVVTELEEFKRPRRLGNGRYMTAATLDGDFRVIGEGGMLDLKATVALLRNLASAVARLASHP